MRWPLLTFLGFVLAIGSYVARAEAQADPIEGRWQQIESNAGACPPCRISIEQGGPSLIVTANNGWPASVTPGGSANRATGVGRWSGSVSGAMAGKPFNVDFVVKDERLFMSMQVDMKNGSRRWVHGVFGRVWVGA